MDGLHAEQVRGGLELFDAFGDEWREFLDRAEDHSPYWRPEWILASLRANSPRAKVVLITVRQSGRLCAILPLVEERGKFFHLPARKLRAPLTTAGVGVDVVSSLPPQERPAAIEAIWKTIDQNRNWDVLELPSVFEGAHIEELSRLGQRGGHNSGRWGLPLIAYFSITQGPCALEELEKYPRHPKLRSKIRQREKKLASLGSVRLRRTEKNGAADLQIFCEMEAAGWKGTNRSAILSNAQSRQFFDEVVRESERFGHLSLYTLELDGKPIAAHIGFTYRGVYWAAKSTYDEKFGDYAPGHLIVKAILRDCAQRGLSQYVMGIREDWKMEWTQDVRRRSYYCIFNRGPWPRMLYTLRFPVHEKLASLKTFTRVSPRTGHWPLINFRWPNVL